MTFETLRFDIIKGVGVARFNRPEALNSLSEKGFGEIEAVLDRAESEDAIKALMFIGTGKAFCVGLDLGLLERAFDEIPYFASTVRRLSRIIERVEALPKPTIAAINGYARAGGFELSLGCDFIVIADNAKIGDAHTDAGVVPACVTMRLKRKVGDQRAKDILWTARWLDADEAVSCGLAIKKFPAASLQDDAIAFANTMTDKPGPAIAMLKQLLNEGNDLSTKDATERELAAFEKYMREEPYGREGYYSFREKRQPFWKV